MTILYYKKALGDGRVEIKYSEVYDDTIVAAYKTKLENAGYTETTKADAETSIDVWEKTMIIQKTPQ